MENVKIVRIFERNMMFFPSSSSHSFFKEQCEVPAKMQSHDYKGKSIPYISMRPYRQEKIQYEALLRDLDFAKSTSIAFDKRFYPSTKNLVDAELIKSSEDLADTCFLNLHEEINQELYQVLILDISELAPRGSSFSSRHYTLNITGLNLLLTAANLKALIIITKANDLEFTALLAEENYKDFLEIIAKLGKKLFIVTEDGLICNISKDQEEPRLASRFLLEHLKHMIAKPYIRNYGHFEVSDKSHIWIFQNFYRLIPDCEEIFLNYFKESIGETKVENDIDAIISFAKPQDPLVKIGGRLQQSLCIKHFSVDNASPIDDVIDDIESAAIMAPLLLTDVIYSGNTARQVILKLKEKKIKVQRLIALSADESSYPKQIEGIPVNVIAPFFLPWWDKTEEECPFCNYDIPWVEKKEGIDVRTQINSSISSFEFYKFVRISEALVEKSIVTHGRNCYRFYFDTAKIFEKFGFYMARVIWKKLGKELGKERDEIDCIVCPGDENVSALLLSIWLSDLSHEKIPVIVIKRKDIEKGWTNELKLKPYRNYINKKHVKNVLIIDDGINRLRTTKVLEKICSAIGVNVLGCSVFLNRAPIEQTEGIEKTWWVYHWPSPPFGQAEFPFEEVEA